MIIMDEAGNQGLDIALNPFSLLFLTLCYF